MNWYIRIVYNRIILYQFVFANAEEWLYKLFMHQACVFENKYQYDMSNKILTNVISVAFTKGHIKLSLKEAIEAFQIKLNNKRKYLAFYIRKSIHNCYDAMTTSPCESMNRHIKHTSKATTLNNTRWVKLSLYELVCTISSLMFCLYYFVYIIPFVNSSISFLCCMHQTISRSLLLITDGTDDRISAIDNSALRELQLSIINSKLPCKNLFHRKCMYLLHDQFDGRIKQKCVCTFLFISLFFQASFSNDVLFSFLM